MGTKRKEAERERVEKAGLKALEEAKAAKAKKPESKPKVEKSKVELKQVVKKRVKPALKKIPKVKVELCEECEKTVDDCECEKEE